MSELAINLRRLMARERLTVRQVAAGSGLDNRTVRAMLAGRNERPHARTLGRLAQGLNVSSDELFADAGALARRLFDRRTNPQVEAVTASNPDLFRHWTEADFDELYSRFGTGGQLTEDGARQAVASMNRTRCVQEQVSVLMETHEAEFLSNIVELLYRRVQAP